MYLGNVYSKFHDLPINANNKYPAIEEKEPPVTRNEQCYTLVLEKSCMDLPDIKSQFNKYLSHINYDSFFKREKSKLEYMMLKEEANSKKSEMSQLKMNRLLEFNEELDHKRKLQELEQMEKEKKMKLSEELLVIELEEKVKLFT